MPQYIKLPNGKTFVQYDYRTDGEYWLRVGRKPWWHRWVKVALVIGLIWLCQPVIYAGLMCLYAGVLLAILGLFLKPLTALGNYDPLGRSKRCRSRRG